MNKVIDTRRVMSAAEFEVAANYVDHRWWMTGEVLIHVPEVMNVDGWNSYGHPGHMLLTSAQRTLMMWSDIVGQVNNGGFTQFCDNYHRDLIASITAVDALDWPELSELFKLAMAEQAGSATEPQLIRPVFLSEEPEKWAASRERFILHLARANKPWWRPLLGRDIAYIRSLFDGSEMLRQNAENLYISAVESGKFPSGGERFFEFVPPPEEQADAFNHWFFSDETRLESTRYIHAFIMRNRDQLYRAA